VVSSKSSEETRCDEQI